MRVRRFPRPVISYGRRTFAEQLPGLTRRYGRRTERLRSKPATCSPVGPMPAWRVASACLCAAARCCGWSKRGLTPKFPAPQLVGIDEYATREGRHYGTVPVCPRTFDDPQDVDQGLGRGVGQSRVHGHQGGLPAGQGSGFRTSHHIPLASHSAEPVVGGVTTVLSIAWMKRNPQMGVEPRP